MLAFIVAIFVSNAQAQSPTPFDIAYENTLKCLVTAQTIENRKTCYAICEKARIDKHDPRCSRLKKDTEKDLLVGLYQEKGKSKDDLNSFLGLALLECKLLSFSSRSESNVNDCISDQYMYNQETLANNKTP
jgi:hypothetical protein